MGNVFDVNEFTSMLEHRRVYTTCSLFSPRTCTLQKILEFYFIEEIATLVNQYIPVNIGCNQFIFQKILGNNIIKICARVPPVRIRVTMFENTLHKFDKIWNLQRDSEKLHIDLIIYSTYFGQDYNWISVAVNDVYCDEI